MTFGAPRGGLPKLFLLEERLLVTGSDPPHAEKSFCIAIAGCLDTVGAVALGSAGLAGAGSGLAHAAFDPHASAVEKAEKLAELLLCVGAFLASAWDVTVDRLNGEDRWEPFAGSLALGAAGAILGGAMSKRSFEAAGADGFEETGGGLDAKLKSPKSFDSNGESTA